MAPARVEWYCGNWADWMLRSNDARGYGPGAVGFNSTGSLSFEDMCAAGDVRVARITSTAIEDLPVVERVAIHHAFLQAVWRFNREPFEMVYPRAIANLGERLERKGLD
jgi:hypothetical protein